ncbi:MAG: FkbM family methyltransferase [Brevundimonas sp.]|uniref:FkbM family methyltransferase n=1 Tax=Brevundimonas sp. TaxID=1871086 RepID=UPI003563CA24
MTAPTDAQMSNAAPFARPKESRAYRQYEHALRLAYRAMGLNIGTASVDLGIPSESAFDVPLEEKLRIGVAAMRTRLKKVNSILVSEFIETPFLKHMVFNGQGIVIPIVNQEAVSWYSQSPMLNFDFIIESFHGMHKDIRTVYDIGGHQGVWALYYSTCISTGGRVFTFEPSIINIEIAALSFYINCIDSINIVPAGVGDDNLRINSSDEGLLISGPPHNINLVKPDWIMWERPDFIKIDIEGYEHEFIKYMPDVFDFCNNIHLEIHVPHLKARGIDYREIYEKIPFDKLNVHKSVWGNLIPVGRDDVLEDFSTLLVTPKGTGGSAG